MKKIFSHDSIKEAVISYLWMIVLPVMIILMLAFALASHYMFRASVSSVQIMQEEILNQYEEEKKKAALSLSHVVNLNDGITIRQVATSLDEEEKDAALAQLDTMYNILAAPDYRLRDIQIYRKDGIMVEPRWAMMYTASSLRQETWYQQALKQVGQVSSSIESKEYFYRIPMEEDLMLVAAMAPKNIQEVECVALYQLSDIPAAIKRYNKDGNLGVTYIADSDGVPVSGSGEKVSETVMTRMKEGKDGKSQFLWNRKRYISSALPATDWFLVSIVSENEVFRNFRLFTLVCLVVLITVVALFTLYYRRYMNRLLMPLQGLMDGMVEIEHHNLQVEVEMCEQQDMARLISVFNSMSVQIRQLVQEKSEAEKEKYREELLALQSRMNPHFLMNTLNTLKLMAVSARFDGMRDMVTALETILAAVLNRDESFYSVEEELMVLNSYIEIMQFRYMDSFEVETEVNADVRNCRIPKLILQPIVENSITHGFDSPEEKRWKIKVRGYREGSRLVFVVYDNGKGMSEETIRNILDGTQKPEKRHSIGVSNTNRRLKLNFGSEYGVSIRSETGFYTEMTLTMPVIGEGEEEHDVSRINCR